MFKVVGALEAKLTRKLGQIDERLARGARQRADAEKGSQRAGHSNRSRPPPVEGSAYGAVRQPAAVGSLQV